MKRKSPEGFTESFTACGGCSQVSRQGNSVSHATLSATSSRNWEGVAPIHSRK